MASYVLLGGAWIGGWAWREVATQLRTKGHDVYPLSLTGLAERVHLGGPRTDLETHISDVVNLIRFEDLSDVVLVGHSYAGSVITGVADRAGDKLKTLVYCDSGPLPNGMRFLDFSPPEAQEQMRRVVELGGEGWKLNFPGFPELGNNASISGLGSREQLLMQTKATPHPFGTYTQPLVLHNQTETKFEQVMILCEDGQKLVELGAVTVPEGWRTFELQTGHWPMLSQPAEIAGILGELG